VYRYRTGSGAVGVAIVNGDVFSLQDGDFKVLVSLLLYKYSQLERVSNFFVDLVIFFETIL